jgi:hypothetical protein
MKWQKKLTKKQLRHIKETTDGGLLREFKRNREAHNKEKAAGKSEPCWECRTIARRLGLEE